MYRYSFSKDSNIIDKTFPFLIYKSEKVHSVREHDHEFWEFVYIYEGRGTCTIGDNSFAFHAHHIFLTPPLVSHTFESHANSRHRQVSIAVDSQLLESISIAWTPIKKMLEQIKQQHKYCIVIPEDNTENIEQRIEAMRREFVFHPENYKIEITLDLTHILISLNRFLYGSQRQFRGIQDLPPLVFSSLEKIEMSYHEISGLSDITPNIKVDKHYFIRIFKKHIGLTPINYLNRVRIEKSCELLLQTHLPIVQIGLDVGFNDLRYFNRQFKRYLGVTPTEFRKQAPKNITLQKSANRFHE